MTSAKTASGNSPGWDDASLRDPHKQRDKAKRVRAMFDAIAPTYERVNRIVSFGRDAAWRRQAVADARVRPGDIVLDLCCGTGDMLRTFAEAHPDVGGLLGIDFAAQMLGAGAYDGFQPQLIRADAQRLPLRDASVDVISCAFGVRNFQDLGAGLAEMRRVLKPGGRVVILEFALPETAPLRWGYKLYTQAVLPRLAHWISRDRTGAYRYLPRSIATFERRGAMLGQLKAAGFEAVTARPMNFGGVVVYRAERG